MSMKYISDWACAETIFNTGSCQIIIKQKSVIKLYALLFNKSPKLHQSVVFIFPLMGDLIIAQLSNYPITQWI